MNFMIMAPPPKSFPLPAGSIGPVLSPPLSREGCLTILWQPPRAGTWKLIAAPSQAAIHENRLTGEEAGAGA